MNCTQVCILKQTNKISFCCFLKCKNSMALESQISLEILSNLTDKTLERKLPDQKFSALLVLTNLTKSNGSRTITVRLLHSTGGWCRFPGSLGGQLFPWSLAAGGFASSLLCTSH